jgi:hypothetical protein
MSQLGELCLIGQTAGIDVVEDMSFAEELVRGYLKVSVRAPIDGEEEQEKGIEVDAEAIHAHVHEWARKQTQQDWRYDENSGPSS